MTLVSTTHHTTHHTSHRHQRSCSRDPPDRHIGQDYSPQTDYDRGGSLSPSRPKTSQFTRERNGYSRRDANGWSYNERPRDRVRDRSSDRYRRSHYDQNRSGLQTRTRDYAYDEDYDDRLPCEPNGRRNDYSSKDSSRDHDKDREKYRARVHQDQNDHHRHQHYRQRSHHNEADVNLHRDRPARRDYRQLDQSSSRYSKDKHSYASYERHSGHRHNDYNPRPRHQTFRYSTSHRRRHYSPRAAPSPSKSPMRRPFDSYASTALKDNDDRLLKRRKIDYRSPRQVTDRRSSRSRIRATSITRSFTPSRSHSRTPSYDYSRSPSRSRTRSRSASRTHSRSYSRSNSTDLYYPPARSPSPVPPQPPRPPKSHIRSTSLSRGSDVLSYNSVHSTSSSRSPRHPRRTRSFRSRAPLSEFSVSSLDGRPCDVTTRSRSPKRTRSRSGSGGRKPRHRSLSLSVISGYSRTPFERRSSSRSPPTAHTSSDRRLSSSSRHQNHSQTRSSSSRERFSSPQSFRRSRPYRRQRSIDDDIGPHSQPARHPYGPRFAAAESPIERRGRGSDRWYKNDSNRPREYSPPKPHSQPPRPSNQNDPSDLDDPPKAPRAHREAIDPSLSPVATMAPPTVSSPPPIPKPPQSPKRFRSSVQSVRKAPGMPPTAPVAQTSAGVRRFFPADDEDDELFEPVKSSTLVWHPEDPQVDVESNPKPPSPSPPPLPPPPPSPPLQSQKSPLAQHFRQQNYRRLSPAPPPPPPSAPPPPPPPLSPMEIARSNLAVGQDSTYNRLATSSQRKHQLSPRSHYRDTGAVGHRSSSPQKLPYRFSNRRPPRDSPSDPSTDSMSTTTIKNDWATPSKPVLNNNIFHGTHKIGSTIHSHPPISTNGIHHVPNAPLGPPVGRPGFQRQFISSVASQMVNQAHAPQQQTLGVPRMNPSSIPPSAIGPPQIINGRRETKEVYERIVQVGEGTYGKVYKARNTETSEVVAMKRIRMEAEKDGFPITAIREIKLLQNLRHPNIVNLVEMVVSKGHVYIVFEYMDHDLSGVLHHPHIHFSPAHTKSLMWQLLSGLQYMHERGVLHRDLKGSNILLTKTGQLKIADFGLARRFERGKEAGREGRGRGRDYTNRVITLWYKPPELLFGATVYGEEVDMWSAGAIFLELFTRRPIFQTGDEIDQLHATFKLMGTPTETNWPEAFDLPWFELFKPKVKLPSKLRETFFGPDKHVKTEAGMCLAERLLTLRPYDRPSAREALKSPYFTEEEPSMELPTELLSTVKGEWHELESKRARRRRDI